MMDLAKQSPHSIKQDFEDIKSSILFPVRCIRKAVYYYRTNGFIGFMKRIRLSVFVYREAVMRHKQLGASGLDFTDSLNIHVASEKDIEEGYEDVWHTKEEALEKLREGHILFLVEDKGANIYYGWVDLLKVDIPWLGIEKLHIPPNVAYMATAYVPPQYRGRLLLKRALKFIEKYLSDNRAVDKLFCVTAPDNVVGRIAALCGYSSYQHVKFFNIMGLKLYVVEPENKEPGTRKIFVQTSDFWDVFSSILETK